MRILVIGATGYVGGHAARHLRASGHDVSGLARSEQAMTALSRDGIRAVVGDLEEIEQLIPLIGNFEALLFAPQLDLESEQEVVTRLLAAIAGSGTRFLFVSGAGVLAMRTDGDWSEASFAEDDPFTPSPYVGFRCETESLVRAAADRGIHAMVVRPPLIWGNGYCPPLASLHESAQTGAICYLGRGLNLYSHVHVEDLAVLIRLILEKGTPGALYHAVAGEVNWRSLAEVVARLRRLPTRSIEYHEAEALWGEILTAIMFAACSRTRSPRSRAELGWAPSGDRLDIFQELGHPKFMAIPV